MGQLFITCENVPVSQTTAKMSVAIDFPETFPVNGIINTEGKCAVCAKEKKKQKATGNMIYCPKTDVTLCVIPCFGTLPW